MYHTGMPAEALFIFRDVFFIVQSPMEYKEKENKKIKAQIFL